MINDSVDGNLYALNKYLKEEEKKDEAWNDTIDDFADEVEKVTSEFSAVMDRFYKIKSEIASALDERGLANDDEVVMNIMTECDDNDLVEEINSIDW